MHIECFAMYFLHMRFGAFSCRKKYIDVYLECDEICVIEAEY